MRDIKTKLCIQALRRLVLRGSLQTIHNLNLSVQFLNGHVSMVLHMYQK